MLANFVAFVLQVEEKISQEQRKYYLTEQLKQIKKELGLDKDEKTVLLNRFKDNFKKFEGGAS